MKCKQGRELQVLSSNAGFYIGTTDDSEGFEEPYCRCSGYSSSKENMEMQLKANVWELRDCVENQYCNEGKGCVD